jgi:hypothetical protein
MEGIARMERLIGAILLKAIDDWEDPQRRPDVEEFLESAWFNELAETLDLDPTLFKNRLRQQRYHRMKIRAAYR